MITPFVKGLFSSRIIAAQAHPKNEDTIVSAQQHVKPMCVLSMHRKGTIKWMITLHEDGAVKEQNWEEDDARNFSGPTPCIMGEFRATLDMLFDTLSEAQTWFIFCMNPNDLQLSNQLEGQSVKGQIRSLGLTEVSKRNVNTFEVGLTLEGFCMWYKEPMVKMGIMDSLAKEKVEWTRQILGLQEIDMILSQYKVNFECICVMEYKDSHYITLPRSPISFTTRWLVHLWRNASIFISLTRLSTITSASVPALVLAPTVFVTTMPIVLGSPSSVYSYPPLKAP